MAANPGEGEVEITLDKRRILKLTWRGVSIFSKATGISVDTFMKNVQEEIAKGELPRFDHMAALLHACLIHEDSKLTVEQAEELFQHEKSTTWVEKQLEVMRKLNEVYALRQGWDPKKATEKAKEAGGAEVPPDQSPASSTS